MRTRCVFFAAIALCLAALRAPADPGSLVPELEPLRAWLGKTWKSEPAAQADKRKVDVARLERALNGMAVHILR